MFAELGLEFEFSDSLTDPTSGTGFGFNVISAAVPEPGDYAPFIVLLLGFAVWLRRRKAASVA